MPGNETWKSLTEGGPNSFVIAVNATVAETGRGGEGAAVPNTGQYSWMGKAEKPSFDSMAMASQQRQLFQLNMSVLGINMSFLGLWWSISNVTRGLLKNKDALNEVNNSVRAAFGPVQLMASGIGMAASMWQVHNMVLSQANQLSYFYKNEQGDLATGLVDQTTKLQQMTYGLTAAGAAWGAVTMAMDIGNQKTIEGKVAAAGLTVGLAALAAMQTYYALTIKGSNLDMEQWIRYSASQTQEMKQKQIVSGLSNGSWDYSFRGADGKDQFKYDQTYIMQEAERVGVSPADYDAAIAKGESSGKLKRKWNTRGAMGTYGGLAMVGALLGAGAFAANAYRMSKQNGIKLSDLLTGGGSLALTGGMVGAMMAGPAGWAAAPFLGIGGLAAMGLGMLGQSTGWYASGGIFTKPTIAGIGDVPEAVIPLDKMNQIMGPRGTVNLNVYTNDSDTVANIVRKNLNTEGF